MEDQAHRRLPLVPHVDAGEHGPRGRSRQWGAVHRHFANPSVVRTDNQTGLNIGAGMGGKQTCAALEKNLIPLRAA